MGHKWVHHVWRTLHTFNGTKTIICWYLEFHVPSMGHTWVPHIWRTLHSFNGTKTITFCMENSTFHQWDTNECLVYGEYHVPSMGHNRVPRLWRKPHSLSGTKSGALCMENATLHQLDTNERLVFVFGECHAHSMGRKWVPRVKKISLAFNRTKTSRFYMVNATLLQLNRNECLVDVSCRLLLECCYIYVPVKLRS